MCDPITAMGAASLGAGVFGSIQSAMGANAAANEKAKQDQLNKQLAEAQAADALQRGATQAGLARMRGSSTVASQRAGFAASGVDENTGTALQVQGSTDLLADLDARTAMNNAARQAWGYETQGLQYGQQAQLDRAAGDQAVAGTVLGGIGSAMGGLGSLLKNRGP